jgi:signal transduction histidine kinase
MANHEGQLLWERLELATTRMQLLIDDLLEYSHVSIRPVEIEEIDLNEKLETVLGDLEIAIEDKKATINVSPLPTVKGYRRQIQQLFQTLISNALKYSRINVDPEININARVVTGSDIELNLTDEQRSNIFYLIEITDNGIGFDQKYAEQIFKMFQRLHSKNEYCGSGVGLSIARKVVENHRGYITAKSEIGKGAQFKVYLPK